jgi:RNA polymerase sigma-70 factor (ECF subfamily)
VDYDLIVPYIPNLRRYARALVGDRDGADDLVQDTLERAVRKFHLWRPGDLRAWLFSIMHNVFVNQLKARRISPDVEIDETFAARVPGVTRADVMDLQRALGTLAPEQREVVLLVALEDMSYADVSRALGIPMGTVMSRLSRGRERLRRVMNGEPAARTGLKVVQ